MLVIPSSTRARPIWVASARCSALPRAKAVVLVTHDMAWVKEYCNRALLLENGHVVVEGSPDEVVAVHRQHTEEAKQRKAAEARQRLQMIALIEIKEHVAPVQVAHHVRRADQRTRRLDGETSIRRQTAHRR